MVEFSTTSEKLEYRRANFLQLLQWKVTMKELDLFSQPITNKNTTVLLPRQRQHPLKISLVIGGLSCLVI